MESANIESHPVHVGLTKGPISKYHQHMILQVKFPTNRLSFPETHSNRNITDEKPCSPLLPLEHLPDYCLQAQTHLSDFLDSVHRSMCTSVVFNVHISSWCPTASLLGLRHPGLAMPQHLCTSSHLHTGPVLASPQILLVATVSGYEWKSHTFPPVSNRGCIDVKSAVVVKPKCQSTFHKVFSSRTT